MKHQLLKVRIDGFRCLADVSFEPSDRMTLLVGANGSGKSSLLEALGFVADLVRLDRGVLQGEARGAIGGQVTLAEMVTAGRTEPLVVELVFRVQDLEYQYVLRVAPLQRSFEVFEERLVVRTEGGIRLLAERDPQGARIRRAHGVDSHLVPVGVVDQASILTLGLDAVSYPEVAPATRYVAGICLFQPVPVLMRAAGVAATDDGRPDRYGRDLATRVFRLQNARPRAVADWLARLDFLGWSEIRTPVSEGRVVPEFIEVGNPNPIRLAQASDGSLAAAYLATLCLDPPSGVTLFLVDEPGTPFFPLSGRNIGELLRAVSHLRQTVVASQSPTLVEGAGNMDNVWLLNRRAGGTTVLTPYPKEDDLAADEVALKGIGDAAFCRVEPSLWEDEE